MNEFNKLDQAMANITKESYSDEGELNYAALDAVAGGTIFGYSSCLILINGVIRQAF